MRTTSVLAVILNWNRPDETARCAEHVLAQSNAKPDVLIVDNGSADETLERLRTLAGCRTLALGSNEGFAGGMNAGLTEALRGSYECVWLLNNDAFAEPDCLQTLLRRMEHDPGVAMVTPRLLSVDGTEQHAGGVVDWYSGDIALFASNDLADPLPEGRWLTGTAPLVRTRWVKEAGLFERDFFAYWEDADLCTRINRAGGKLVAVPDAAATHIGNGSSGTNSPFVEFLRTRNAWLFLKRNARVGSNRIRWLRFVARSTERAAFYDLKGQPALATAVLAGLSAARQQRFGPPAAARSPALLERLAFWRPWRVSHVLGRVADWLEPEGGTRLAPTYLK
jgi:GT2 family glycosyltransferase